MKRGEIYYVVMGPVPETGSEQRAGRPAVIVSNDSCNEKSSVVEVVYLTCQVKPDMPTHVTVRSSGKPSTVLCEQICSISKSRIREHVGTCTNAEMQRIDTALMVSLGIDYPDTSSTTQELESVNESYETLEVCESAYNSEELREAVIRVEAERDTYKELYENLLAKMLRKKRETK